MNEIAHTIQLAVAPVFVLTGIGGFLNVLTGRLARVIDRARKLEERFIPEAGVEHDRMVGELRVLDRRMTLVNAAIFLCTASAVAICVLVALLFLSDLAELRYGRAIAVLFTASMALLIAGLITFLVEVRVATRSLRVPPELLERGPR